MNKLQRQEVGKWFLDVAKYVVTAVIVSTIFNEVDNLIFVIVFGLFAFVLLFAIGLHYLGDKKQKKK